MRSEARERTGRSSQEGRPHPNFLPLKSSLVYNETSGRHEAQVKSLPTYVRVEYTDRLEEVLFGHTLDSVEVMPRTSSL